MMPRFPCFSSSLTLITYKYEHLKATKFALLAYALIFVQKNYTTYIEEHTEYYLYLTWIDLHIIFTRYCAYVVPSLGTCILFHLCHLDFDSLPKTRQSPTKFTEIDYFIATSSIAFDRRSIHRFMLIKLTNMLVLLHLRRFNFTYAPFAHIMFIEVTLLTLITIF
jgi:hypothetical protein